MKDGIRKEAAATEQSAELLEIWRSVLGDSRITPADDFFALGGDSLRAVQILLRMQQRLRVSVTLEEFFERPSVESLIELIACRQDCDQDQIRPRSLTTPPPVSDMQEVHLARLADWKLLPLTHPQQNICVGHRLVGPLNESALRGAVERVCQRHEILRTHFDVSTDPPTQIIEAEVTPDFTVIDLRDPDEQRRAGRVEACIEELKQRPFNCLKAPIIRFHLLRLAQLESLFIVTTCHLIMDGWSFGLFQDELAECYRLLARGAEVPARPAATQYADFAHWQRTAYPRKEQEALRYWRDVLAGFRSLGLEIPNGRTRSENFEYRTALLSRDLGDTHRTVLSFSQREQVTVYAVYLSAYAILLWKLSKKRCMLVFTPSAQRIRIELEGVIGRFTRSLLLRVQIEPRLTFGEFVHRTAQNCLEAQRHLEVCNVKFNALLPEMVYGEQEKDKPLSYVAFSYEQLHRLRLEGLEVHDVDIITASGPWFDLNLRVFTHETGTRVSLTYNPDSYGRDTCDYILDSYSRIAQAAVSNESATLDELLLASDADGQMEFRPAAAATGS
jgi:acyl carrier protein